MLDLDAQEAKTALLFRQHLFVFLTTAERVPMCSVVPFLFAMH